MKTIFNVFSVKRFLILFVIIIFALPQRNNFAQPILNSDSLKKLENTHDLSLPDWGPYTKRYIGVSHIPDKKSGF